MFSVPAVSGDAELQKLSHMLYLCLKSAPFHVECFFSLLLALVLPFASIWSSFPPDFKGEGKRG